MLESFIDVRLKLFETQRNDPNVAALSQLSPWIRFGRYPPAPIKVDELTLILAHVAVAALKLIVNDIPQGSFVPLLFLDKVN